MLLCSICYFSLRSQCLISFYSFFTCARICTSEFLRHTTISLIKCLLRISFYTIQSTSCFGQRFPHFLDYFIRLPLVLKSVQLISASYPWFWTGCHDFRIGFNPCPAYFRIFTFGFQQVSKLFHDFTTGSYQIQTYANILPLFPSNCTTYFSISVGLQSLFRIFQQLTLGVHLFFPLPGLVFISVFFRSLSHQLSSLCHCFFAFYVQPCSFCSSPVILLALSLYGLYCDILFHQFWSCVIVFFVGLIMLYIYISLSL